MCRYRLHGSREEHCLPHRCQTLLQRDCTFEETGKAIKHKTTTKLHQKRQTAPDQILPLQPRQTVQTKSRHTEETQRQTGQSTQGYTQEIRRQEDQPGSGCSLPIKATKDTGIVVIPPY